MLSILTLAIIDWMQFGLAGVTFATLAGMVMKILKLLKDKGKDSDNSIEAMRKEMLSEIEKREIRLIDLQEKTLKALYKMASAFEKMANRLSDLEDTVDEGNDEKHQN